MHMAERDAERENGGDAMISFWRVNILDFWEHGHYKYLTLALWLLSCKYTYFKAKHLILIIEFRKSKINHICIFKQSLLMTCFA